MVEFREDARRSGALKLIEVNVRMPRINWLPTVCGVNFPVLAYRDLTGAPPPRFDPDTEEWIANLDRNPYRVTDVLFPEKRESELSVFFSTTAGSGGPSV